MVSASGLFITGSSMVMSMRGSAAPECPMRLPSPTRSIRNSAPGLPHRPISLQNPQPLLNEVLYAARVPTFEDKVAQRAVVLEAIYEQDFLPCSYGFRPGRSAHQALDALRAAFMGQGVRWCIDVDIKKYFDTIDHGHLRDFLNRRVTDGVIRRMIDKWLKAGVLEEGRLHRPTAGSGGV